MKIAVFVLSLVFISIVSSAAFSSDLAFSALDTDNLQLASVNAAVMELNSNNLLYSKNGDRIVSIASITKLMTAIVVLSSNQDLDELVKIAKRARTDKNAYSRIRIDSKISRKELLRIALMSSENLAAYNLAYHYPGGVNAFVAAMNAEAKKLGMTNTHFVDSSGLSVKNTSTANDLTKMITKAFSFKQIGELSTTTRHTARFSNPRYRLGYGNTNILVHRTAWDVALTKTGYLKEAGRCLVMVTEIDGKNIAMILLDSFGSRSPQGDAGRIKRWIKTGTGGRVAGAALKYERSKVNL